MILLFSRMALPVDFFAKPRLPTGGRIQLAPAVAAAQLQPAGAVQMTANWPGPPRETRRAVAGPAHGRRGDEAKLRGRRSAAAFVGVTLRARRCNARMAAETQPVVCNRCSLCVTQFCLAGHARHSGGQHPGAAAPRGWFRPRRGPAMRM